MNTQNKEEGWEERFALIWGEAPEGTSKYDKGQAILNFFQEEITRASSLAASHATFVEGERWAELFRDKRKDHQEEIKRLERKVFISVLLSLLIFVMYLLIR